jgi:hypothetical protein
MARAAYRVARAVTAHRLRRVLTLSIKLFALCSAHVFCACHATKHLLRSLFVSIEKIASFRIRIN